MLYHIWSVFGPWPHLCLFLGLGTYIKGKQGRMKLRFGTAVPRLLAPRTGFVQDTFSIGQGIM